MKKRGKNEDRINVFTNFYYLGYDRNWYIIAVSVYVHISPI